MRDPGCYGGLLWPHVVETKTGTSKTSTRTPTAKNTVPMIPRMRPAVAIPLPSGGWQSDPEKMAEWLVEGQLHFD